MILWHVTVILVIICHIPVLYLTIFLSRNLIQVRFCLFHRLFLGSLICPFSRPSFLPTAPAVVRLPFYNSRCLISHVQQEIRTCSIQPNTAIAPTQQVDNPHWNVPSKVLNPLLRFFIRYFVQKILICFLEIRSDRAQSAPHLVGRHRPYVTADQRDRLTEPWYPPAGRDVAVHKQTVTRRLTVLERPSPNIRPDLSPLIS